MPPSPPQDPRTRLAETLWNDPDTRPYMESAMVRKFGDKAKSAIPLYQEREALYQDRQEWQQEREQIKAEREQEKAQRALEQERRKVMDDPQLRVKPDEIPHIEKLMNDELIGTHGAAARLYRASQHVASPRGFDFAASVPGLGGAGGDEFKGLVDNPDKWARDRTMEILNDFQGGRGDKWL